MHAHASVDDRQYQRPKVNGDSVAYHLWDLSGIRLIARCNSHAFIEDGSQQVPVSLPGSQQVSVFCPTVCHVGNAVQPIAIFPIELSCWLLLTLFVCGIQLQMDGCFGDGCLGEGCYVDSSFADFVASLSTQLFIAPG